MWGKGHIEAPGPGGPCSPPARSTQTARRCPTVGREGGEALAGGSWWRQSQWPQKPRGHQQAASHLSSRAGGSPERECGHPQSMSVPGSGLEKGLR